MRIFTPMAGFLFVVMLQACGPTGGFKGDIKELQPFTWDMLDSGTFQINDLKKNKASVLITLDPECPMCANYSKVINELSPKYSMDSIQFYGIFTSPSYSDAEIKAFAVKYNVDIPFILDPDYRLASFFGAEVTPEVFVMNQAGQLVYQGLLDNWAIALGKKRKKASKHYLADALEAIKMGTEPEVNYTKAIGCIIEYEIE